jgi:hypothetical protein
MSQRVERPQHVEELGLDGGEAGCDIDDDGKERKHECGNDRGHRSDAEPDHQDRHERCFGHAVERDQDGIKRRIGQAKRTDDDPERQSENDRHGKSGKRRRQGCQAMDRQRIAELVERRKRLDR